MPADPGKHTARLHQSTDPEKEEIGVQLFRGHYTRRNRAQLKSAMSKEW
jgi:hypothetical protein